MDEIAMLYGINVVEEAEHILNRPARKFYTQIRQNPFQILSEDEFSRHFRLTKDLVNILINLVSELIPSSRVSALDVTTKVLITLRFLASGSYQLDIGSNIFLGTSQATASRAIAEVVDALNEDVIFNQFVKFPNNLVEMNNLRQNFYTKFRFPGVVGCIDCTHIAIIAPRTNDDRHPEHIYINRKRYHSINVQLICDANLRIMNVNSRFPGSTHDSFIWNNSTVKPIMENIYRNGRNGYYLLGDSGYALRPWLLTPLEEQPEENSPEARYNERHKSTRNVIERCNGLLKSRFRCLLKHRVLHYTPTKASKIINACVVLHNMCVSNNVPLIIEEENNVDFGIIENEPFQENNRIARLNADLIMGRRIRHNVIRNYFN